MYQSEIGRWNRIDDKADKYYSLSPFNFVANNPIVFVDNKGQDIIVIGSGGYNKSVANAFVEYVKTPEGARVFEKLRSNDNIRVVIHMGQPGNNELYESEVNDGVTTAYIHYDPNSGGIIDGVERTGITSISHELKHAEQLLDGESPNELVLDSDQPSKDWQGFQTENTIKKGEFGAVDSENRVRSSLGVGIRKSYEGSNVFTRAPSNDSKRINIPGVGTFVGKYTVGKNGASYASFSGKTAQAVFSKLVSAINAGKSVNVNDFKPKSRFSKAKFNRDDKATLYED
jgi:Effector protein